jgi:hypothetical protein
MYLQHRVTREVIDIKEENGQWVIDGDEATSARLALFLLDRCGDGAEPSILSSAGNWDHATALARTLPVQSEFEQPSLVPFDTKWFWGSWKWIGWYATEFTWVGRWIMHSVVRRDPRAISLCIDWIKRTRFPEQAAVLAYAVQHLSGEPPRSPREWVRWYEGGWFSKGAKQRFPEVDINTWLAELKRQSSGES